MINEAQVLTETLKLVAQHMVVAARTAPKGRGKGQIVAAIAEKDDILKISEKMNEMARRDNTLFFARDAANILLAPYLVLIGSRIEPLGLSHCGLCGFINCDGKRQHPDSPCAFNTTDLGIALGSATALAADMRADTRVMFSVGMAARELGIMEKDVRIIFGIPLTATSKNPFFDRPAI